MNLTTTSRLIATAGLLSVACAGEPILKPAPSASIAAGQADIATAEVAGVRVFVSGDSWKGDPKDLPEMYTPVLLRLENHSGKAVRITYHGIHLEGSTGFRYQVLPPLLTTAAVDAAYSSFEPAVTPRFGHDQFFVAPHYSSSYPELPAWQGAFPYDPTFHDDGYYLWRTRLPTTDMVAEALPEGAVENGGSVAGFIYFQEIRPLESAARFVMVLADADGGATLGRISIPFVTAR